MDEKERQELINEFRKIRENWTEKDEEEAKRITSELPSLKDAEITAILIPRKRENSEKKPKSSP